MYITILNCLNLGSNYCLLISNDKTMDYISWLKRTQQVSVNSMEIEPISFANKFTNNIIKFACNASKKYPFRYNQNAQQAAKQQLFFLNTTECPFSHNTCPLFCYLYYGSSFSNRIDSYEKKKLDKFGRKYCNDIFINNK